MAFNWQTFRTRALTAVVFVVVMMGGLLWNRWSFLILFSIVHFGCWIEYQRLVSAFNKEYTITPFHKYGVLLAGWCGMLYCAHTGFVRQPLWLWLALALVILICVTDILLKKADLKSWGYSFFGLIYISLSLALFVNLRNHWQLAGNDLNRTIPLLIIFSIWINDTMAYIVGSIIGKTPLSKISPKKTWEGTLGGIILAILVMGGIAYGTHYVKPAPAMIIAGIASVTGTVGDLFESKLKRMAGVKDSGRIMPGHGGFLDRFDSLLFAAFFVSIYVMLFL